MIRVHKPHRDAHAAFIAATDTLIAAHAAPGTLDMREALENETARRIASFTQRLCSEEVL